MSRAFRPDSIPMPTLFCPRHGDQPGRTICRWCSHGKHVNHSAISSLPGVLGRTDSGVAPFLFQSEHGSDDVVADSSHKMSAL
jgi:hypothetical protein